MEITPKQFSGLLVELKKIREHLEQLREDRSQQITSINAAEQRREHNRNIQPVWLDPILSKYKQPESERKAEGSKQYSVQNSVRWATWFTFAATLGAFVAAAVYAHYAHQTLLEIQKQTPQIEKSADSAINAANTARETLANSQKAFEMDERPYLVMESRTPVFALKGFVPNEKLSVNVNFKNIGKQPAIRMMLEIHLLNYQAPDKQLTDKELQVRLRNFTDSWFEKMRRNARTDTNTIGEYVKGHGEDVAPGDSWFASTNDSYVISPSEYANIANDTDAKGLLLLFIVITYQDGFGTSYETDSCRMFWGTHSEIWHRCPAYNIIR